MRKGDGSMINFIKNKISYIIIFAISLALATAYFLLMWGKDVINSFVLCLCLIAAGAVCRLVAKKFGVASITATVTAVAVWWVYFVIRTGGLAFLAPFQMLASTLYIVVTMSLFAFGDMTVSILLYLLKGKSKKDGETTKGKTYSRTELILYPIFAFCAFTFGMVLFIIKAEEITMPSPPGSWFGPAITLLFIMLAALGLFFFAAVIIKALMAQKIRISFLLVIAVSMSVFQFCTANSLFFYGQPLHSTIEEGGIFYPIYESRNTLASGSDDVEGEAHFVYLEATAYGRGIEFFCGVSYDNYNDKRNHDITLAAGFESKVQYFELYVTPRADIAPESVEFYAHYGYYSLPEDSFEISSEVLDDGRIKLKIIPHWVQTEGGRNSIMELKWNILK
jgi:hypothetical protein